MITIEAFIRTFRRESAGLLHLYRKMPVGALDYRPTPAQRNTLEVMRYVSFGPYNGVRKILAGDWKVGMTTAEATKDMPPSDFPRAVIWQANEVTRLLQGVNSETLQKETILLPWGEVESKAEALFNQPLKWLIGYRMQMFLYLKAAGGKDLATPDLWMVREDAAGEPHVLKRT